MSIIRFNLLTKCENFVENTQEIVTDKETKSAQPSFFFLTCREYSPPVYRYALVFAEGEAGSRTLIFCEIGCVPRPSARRESETGFARLPESREFLLKGKSFAALRRSRTPTTCGVSACGGNLLPRRRNPPRPCQTRPKGGFGVSRRSATADRTVAPFGFRAKRCGESEFERTKPSKASRLKKNRAAAFAAARRLCSVG